MEAISWLQRLLQAVDMVWPFAVKISECEMSVTFIFTKRLPKTGVARYQILYH